MVLEGAAYVLLLATAISAVLVVALSPKRRDEISPMSGEGGAKGGSYEADPKEGALALEHSSGEDRAGPGWGEGAGPRIGLSNHHQGLAPSSGLSRWEGPPHQQVSEEGCSGQGPTDTIGDQPPRGEVMPSGPDRGTAGFSGAQPLGMGDGSHAIDSNNSDGDHDKATSEGAAPSRPKRRRRSASRRGGRAKKGAGRASSTEAVSSS